MFLSSLPTECLYEEGGVRRRRRGQGLEENMAARDLSRAELFLLPYFIHLDVTTSKATHTLGAL